MSGIRCRQRSRGMLLVHGCKLLFIAINLGLQGLDLPLAAHEFCAGAELVPQQKCQGEQAAKHKRAHKQEIKWQGNGCDGGNEEQVERELHFL